MNAALFLSSPQEQLPNTLMKALKAQEDVSKNLCLMRTFLYSTIGEVTGNEPQPDPQVSFSRNIIPFYRANR